MNASRLLPYLLGGGLLLASTSCNKCREPQPDLSPVQVSYTQTQCADKWGQAPTPAQLVSAATTYLAQQGITLLSAQASQAGPPAACYACTCPTGVVLTGAVAPADIAAVQALGFKLK